ncbi:hypothetical protein BB561_005368 [Smittium simulii]|uniref:5-methyltetrahydropteroyltriglutamate--homocysteine S-methyltransferase n=1 Tax=Smittium simulii TaxID=133385 RepID=A0A2T9YAP6_9FUNG|nr:hypothetical protein BB561_005368 [Smittium simulii]
MVNTTVLGFPRMGSDRQLKKLVEAYWNGKVTLPELTSGAQKIRASSWDQMKSLGLDFVTVGDFSLYDHILDTAIMFNVVPPRFQEHFKNELDIIYSEVASNTFDLSKWQDIYFALARGIENNKSTQNNCVGEQDCNNQKKDGGLPSLEMKKWFDTNYHSLVPEISSESDYKLVNLSLVEEFEHAKKLGHNARAVIVGPITFLYYCKLKDSLNEDSNKYSHAKKLIKVYAELIIRLENAGCEWIQFDEPILSTDIDDNIKEYFQYFYKNIDLELENQKKNLGVVNYKKKIKFLLANYFGDYNDILSLALELPFDGYHFDLVYGKKDLSESLFRNYSTDKVISLGIIDGRNIWKNDSAESETILNAALKYIPNISAISGSILCDESNPKLNRSLDYQSRKKLQSEIFKLPLLPTTSIGSFPQTLELRKYRQQYKKGEITKDEYDEFIYKKTEQCIQWQLDLGIDVLVHGEYERNDMVEFFGENMTGFTTTKNGWVQSYGSRCVKPPIIYADVSRVRPMTLEITKFAQDKAWEISNNKNIRVKGMLTGPVTIIQWSFVRNDVHISRVAEQIAYAIREEVLDLEKNGIEIIQVDEPAIREGLPLRSENHEVYKKWAVNGFKLSTSGVKNETMIHTHMCYSDFNEILPLIKRMDTDVLTVENSKSDLKLITENCDFAENYHAGIGPGIYDVHSPIIPSKKEIYTRLAALLKVFEKDALWVNPDCGNKTRTEEQVDLSLKNMIAVAKELRALI